MLIHSPPRCIQTIPRGTLCGALQYMYLTLHLQRLLRRVRNCRTQFCVGIYRKTGNSCRGNHSLLVSPLLVDSIQPCRSSRIRRLGMYSSIGWSSRIQLLQIHWSISASANSSVLTVIPLVAKNLPTLGSTKRLTIYARQFRFRYSLVALAASCRKLLANRPCGP